MLKRIAAVAALMSGLAVMLAGPSLPAAGAQSNALIATVAFGSAVPLQVRLHHARRLGEVSPSSRISLALTLKLRHQDALNATLAAIASPASPSYRHYLTQAQVNQRFNPTTAQQNTVINWLSANGLSVTRTFVNHLIVDASGTAAQVNHAFGVTLTRYRGGVLGRVSNFYAPSTTPRMPAAVGTLVSQAFGLNDTDRMRSDIRSAGRVAALRGVRRHGYIAGDYYPSDFQAAYDSAPVTNAAGAFLGQQHIGIIMWCAPPSTILLGLWAAFVNSPPPSVSVHDYSGGQSGYGDFIESDLDVEYASGVASSALSHAAIDYYQAAAGGTCSAASDPFGDSASIANALNAAGTTSGGSIDSQISGSFGGCGTALYDGVLASDSLTGHNFFFSTGDHDANDCGNYPEYPASSPYVTGVGGTAFGTCGNLGPNPITSYPGEVAWCGDGSSGSGGGFDGSDYTTPAFQTGVGRDWNQYTGCLSAGTCRGAPDVAGPADPTQSGALVCNDNQSCYQIGGTSEASPIWAGFTADMNAAFAANGAGTLGPLDPQLYGLAYNPTAYARDFHDITSGSNGFNAATGWDPVTGLGSPDLAQLYADLGTGSFGQYINFAALPDHVAFDAPFTVSATTSSGQTVSFTASGQCSAGGANGATITLTAGSCTVTAHQTGGGRYLAAADVSQSFNIAPKYSQVISFGGPPTQFIGDANSITLNASTTSGLPVTFTASGDCTAGGSDGSLITLTQVGQCTVTAHQPGDAEHFAAGDISHSFSILLPNGWTPEASTPQALRDTSAASAPCENNLSATCIYQAGGATDADFAINGVLMYDPSTNTWTPVASLHAGRAAFAMTNGPCVGSLTATCLYAIGGFDSNLNVISSVEMYAPGSNGWTTVTSLPAGLVGAGAAAAPCYGNTGATCVYSVGGQDASFNLPGSVFMFNPATNSWSSVAGVGSLAGQDVAAAPCVGALSSTCVYAYGGNASSSGIPIVNTALMYNPASNTWTGLPGMSDSRASSAGANGPCPANVSDTCVYAVGGEDNNFNSLSSAEAFDPATDSWGSVKPMSIDRFEIGAASGPCQGNISATCVYALDGGGDNVSSRASIEMLSINNKITVSVHASGLYGATPDISMPAGDPSITVGPSSNLSSALSGTLTCGTAATASSHASATPFSVTGCGGLSAPGFSIQYDNVGSGYTVQPAPLTVTAHHQKTSFNADFTHAFSASTVTVSGLVAGDTLSTLNGSVTSPNYVVGDAPGSYEVDASIADTDYAPSPTPGTLTVTKATIVASYHGQTTATAGKPFTMSATISNPVTGELFAGKKISLTLAPYHSFRQTCQTTSSVPGVATCKLRSVTVPPGDRTVLVNFPGDADYYHLVKGFPVRAIAAPARPLSGMQRTSS